MQHPPDEDTRSDSSGPRSPDAGSRLAPSDGCTLRRFVDDSPRAEAMFDIEMRYLAASQRWCAAHGVERATITGASCYALHAQFAEEWRHVHVRCLGGDTERGERQIRLPVDERLVWARWEARPWCTTGGDIAGVIMRFENVTAERERQLALAAREEQFQITLDAAHAGTWLADPRTRRLVWDRRSRAIYGVQSESDLTTIEAVRAFVAPEDSERSDRVTAEARNAVDGQVWGDEFRIIRPDGSIRWVLTRGQTHRDEGGRAVRIAGITLDVTDRKIAQLNLLQAHANLRADATELERRSTQLQRVASALMLAEQRTRERLSSLLHDHVQQLMLSALLHLRDAADAAPGLASINDAQRDLTDALEETHSLSIDLQPSVLRRGDLPAAIEWLGAWLHERFGITVEESVDPKANPTSEEVRNLVFEAARELLFNVVKHAGVDRVSLTLTLDNADQVRLTVSDAGVGFAPETLARRPGVDDGLGLYGMRERLALFEGRLDVDSAVGEGARFTILVARAPMSVDGPATTVTTEGGETAPVLPAEGPRPLRVLLADDHAATRVALRLLLEPLPSVLIVGEANDGVSAVVLARTLAPDAIVMDASMPRMDGIEATRRILAFLPTTFIVGFSTDKTSDTEHAMELAGADTYLVKDETFPQQLTNHLLRLHADVIR